EFGDKLKVSSWTATGKRREFGEFALLGVDKVNVVHTLLEYLNGDIKDTLALGDAENDVRMLRNCGIGVAMRNAESILKEEADYITDDVEQNGLFNAFKHFGLI